MILARLKQATRPQHDAVESRLVARLDALTAPAYRELLESFWGYYEPLERRLAAAADWPALGFDFERRRKVPLLERDLTALGHSAASIRRLSHCRQLPEVSDLPEALGCLYVLEGSTLGGQVIARMLRPLGVPRASAFFSSYGDEVGPMWKAFGEFVTGRPESAENEEAVVRGAAETFATLDGWLAGTTTGVNKGVA